MACCDTTRPRTINCPQKQFELYSFCQDYYPIFRNNPFMQSGLSHMRMSDRLKLHRKTG